MITLGANTKSMRLFLRHDFLSADTVYGKKNTNYSLRLDLGIDCEDFVYETSSIKIIYVKL